MTKRARVTKKASGNQPIRQGDVILIPTRETTHGEQVKDPRGVVLAEGESSGHHHAIVGRGHKLFERAGSERFLYVGGSGATLRVLGDESRHEPVKVPPGSYLVRVQRSWSSESASRQVQD